LQTPPAFPTGFALRRGIGQIPRTINFAPESSYFPAQNCGLHTCVWNRSICGKLQGRTDLQLTPMAAYESFL
jgi:hypothetical protein